MVLFQRLYQRFPVDVVLVGDEQEGIIAAAGFALGDKFIDIDFQAGEDTGDLCDFARLVIHFEMEVQSGIVFRDTAEGADAVVEHRAVAIE